MSNNSPHKSYLLTTSSTTMTTNQDQPKLPLELQFKILAMVIENLVIECLDDYGLILITSLYISREWLDSMDSSYQKVPKCVERAVQPAVTRVCRAWRKEALPKFYAKMPFKISMGISYHKHKQLHDTNWFRTIGVANTISLGKIAIRGDFDHHEKFIKGLYNALPTELASIMHILFSHDHTALRLSNSRFKLDHCDSFITFGHCELSSAERESRSEWKKVQDVMDIGWMKSQGCTCFPAIRPVSFAASFEGPPPGVLLAQDD